jgi:hypothetical protein
MVAFLALFMYVIIAVNNTLISLLNWFGQGKKHSENVARIKNAFV